MVGRLSLVPFGARPIFRGELLVSRSFSSPRHCSVPAVSFYDWFLGSLNDHCNVLLFCFFKAIPIRQDDTTSTLPIFSNMWMFPKIVVPQIIHFNKVFHYQPSILGYPYFWKHPCACRFCLLLMHCFMANQYRQMQTSTPVTSFDPEMQ